MRRALLIPVLSTRGVRRSVQRAWKSDLVLAALPAQRDLVLPEDDAEFGAAENRPWADLDPETRAMVTQRRREKKQVPRACRPF